MTNGEVAKRLQECKTVDDMDALVKLLVEQQILDCGGMRDALEDQVRSSLRMIAQRISGETERLLKLFDALKEEAA